MKNFIANGLRVRTIVRLDRKIVTTRTIINRLMRTPKRIESIELVTRTASLSVTFEHEGVQTEVTFESKLEGRFYTRIETYGNKKVIQTIANIDDAFLGSIRSAKKKQERNLVKL